MRIDDTSPSGINPSAIGGSQRLRSANEPASPSSTPVESGKGSDKVQFSNVASSDSAQSLSINQSVSAERASRIDQLTGLVQSGQYNPDPHKIADAMIRDMLTDSRSS